MIYLHQYCFSLHQIVQEYSTEIGSDLNDRVIKLFDEDVFKRVGEAQSPRSDFQVILHGDLWYSNFMFRYFKINKCLNYSRAQHNYMFE